MKNKAEPTFAEILVQLVAELDGPIQRDELAARLMEIRMPQAKNPRKAAMKHIREQQGRILILLDPKTVLPVRLAYQGVRFRLPVSRSMAKRGEIPLEPLSSFYHFGGAREPFVFVDRRGKVIPFDVMERKKVQKTAFLGKYETVEPFANLKNWLKANKVRRDDHLLVTIQDWEQAVFRLEVDPVKKQQRHLLEQRNKLLADIFYDMLEHNYDERLWVQKAVPTVYARLPEKSGYPPDHWVTVIQKDPRMFTDGLFISYIDAPPSPFERLLMDFEGVSVAPPLQEFSQEQGEKVYRFKAALKYRKSIWRKIEILGKQTLADFNEILMQAFEWDWDHLGGFWKRVRRGGPKSKKFREVELGTVNPFGDGDGADLPIAGIGLEIGDSLKYVYDFGDWNEHVLTLEAIENPQPDTKYPRVASKNKPRYFYCQDCKESGKRTVATWVCWTCSNETGKAVRVCDDCLTEYHEEHYADEILY